MGAYAISTKVQTGVYAGFTRAEMLTEWARYKAALQASGSRLVGSTVNGQNFQFGPRGDFNLVEWGRQVRFALSQVDPDYIAQPTTIGVRFGCAG
jgi:hypothetical protein